ncbi:MAG: tyrosine-type recombinase/integrase, partial [Chitinophagaceae bacterium]
IKLRVTYKGGRHYYSCIYSATSEEWKQINSEAAKGKLRKIKNEIGQWEIRAQKTSEQISPFSFSQFEDLFLEKKLDRETDSRIREGDIKQMYEDYIGELIENEQIGTASNYQCAINSFLKFKKNLTLKDITVIFLKAYEKWMEKQGKSKTTISMYLRTLRTILNLAKFNGMINEQDYPFGSRKYVIPAGSKVKRALSEEEIKKIFDYQVEIGSSMDKARDFWIFSYLCNGINMMDIAHLKWQDIDKSTIIFERIKTRNINRTHPVKIVIIGNEHIDEIISKWGTSGNNKNGLVFNIISLSDDPKRRKAKILQFIKVVNKWMKRMGEELGFDLKLTTYVARHSFATNLDRREVPLTAIKEMLGHSSIVTTQNYIASLKLKEISHYASLLNDMHE